METIKIRWHCQGSRVWFKIKVVIITSILCVRVEHIMTLEWWFPQNFRYPLNHKLLDKFMVQIKEPPKNEKNENFNISMNLSINNEYPSSKWLKWWFHLWALAWMYGTGFSLWSESLANWGTGSSVLNLFYTVCRLVGVWLPNTRVSDKFSVHHDSTM